MLEFFNTVIDLAVEYKDLYLGGAMWTLVISIFGTCVGFLIGLLVGIVRTVPTPSNKPVKKFILKLSNVLCRVYIDFFRSTPMMVQAMVFFYGLASMDIHLPRVLAGFFVVSINTGAYMSEIVRGGIVSIDKGQFEAARAIGMGHFQTMKNIVLPQVIRNILPATANEFIVNVKDTAVLSVISVTELFYQTKSIAGNNYLYTEAFTVTIFMYLIMTLTITGILRRIEKKLDGPQDFNIVANQMQLINSDDILSQNKIL